MIQKEIKEIDKCSFCNGYGYNLEHHPHCGSTSDDSCSMCPIQVPCIKCKGRGVEVYEKKLLLESTKDIKEKVFNFKLNELEDLPF
jgi:RecJ-like exonuclease